MRPAHLAHERRGAVLCVAARQSPAVPRAEARAWSINLGTLAYHSAEKPRPAERRRRIPIALIKRTIDYAQPDRTGGSLSTGRFTL
jgi:hypothetical protein